MYMNDFGIVLISDVSFIITNATLYLIYRAFIVKRSPKPLSSCR